MIAYTGSRNLNEEHRALVERTLAALAEQEITTGCADGLDSMVRDARPDAKVFRASDTGLKGGAALARRSADMVRAVAASERPGLVAWVDKPCPTGLKPGKNWHAGHGNGTWATVAMAIGNGLPVLLFSCAPGVCPLPDWQGGDWQGGLDGCWARAWRWVPHPKPEQMTLV